MRISLQEAMRNKTVILYAMAGVALIALVSIVILLLNTAKKPDNKAADTNSSSEILKELEAKHAKVSQTLEQEKLDRAKVHEALEAPNNYKKLAF